MKLFKRKIKYLLVTRTDLDRDRLLRILKSEHVKYKIYNAFDSTYSIYFKCYEEKGDRIVTRYNNTYSSKNN